MSTTDTTRPIASIYKSAAGAAAIAEQYREVLRTWPIPSERLLVPTREGDTFVIASGPREAPPLVLLHGSGANSGMWRGDIASWAKEFRVYGVDMVGEPGGSAPSRPVLGSEAVALWLDDVLAGLGVSSTAIAAISLGGWTALDYAIRRPERVTQLALLCPGGVGKQRYGWILRAIVPRLFDRHDPHSSARTVTGLEGAHLDAVVDEIVLTFTHFNPRRERLPPFTDAQLRGLNMPVLAVAGDRDVMFDSAETARRITRSVPDATVRVLPGVGHAILGQTDLVLDFLLEHLGRS
ncbi:alpha/beta fold hydrolase [Nocardia sp. NBC_01503]|uniref:alpha/beta fold hydrolase n=1 Tax=Nocardia sp. NBC_01503 TaxID=2975997 RepID=UPI002E7BC600|nr:alpha/beta fold hydrolase [Nocardia sp. NBC_01503]WTL32361.1 alpha/beta fold hydrolase [Nocardia sp. NBC_01503]